MPDRTQPRARRRPRTMAACAAVGVAVLSGGLLAGCGTTDTAPAAEAADSAFPVTVEHTFGATTVPAAPERIVALGTSDVDVLYALGIDPVGVVAYPGWAAADDEGVAQWVADDVDPAVTTYIPDGAESLELIATLDPDLILLTYGSLEEGVYDQLSELAPTIAPLDGDWQLDWRQQLTTIGEAVGRTDEAATLQAGLEDQIAEAAAAHPDLDGATYSFIDPSDGELWVYLSGDPRNELFEELGLVPSAGSKALLAGNDSFFGTLSYEEADTIDADVLITLLTGYSSLTDLPVLGTLDAVTAGAVVAYGDDDEVFKSALVPSPLTIPLVLDRLPDELSAALAVR